MANRQYEYAGDKRELYWGNETYRRAASGEGLAVDLSSDHGPILRVTQRYDSMGVTYILVFFLNMTYTGAQLVSKLGAERAFIIVSDYISRFNASIVPLQFYFGYDDISFDLNGMKSKPGRSSGMLFPGARKLKLPFKEAVERHFAITYGNRIDEGLTKADIYRDDPVFYQALHDYKKKFGSFPSELKSVREIAKERFERVSQSGLTNAPRRDRDAAHRLARRLSKSHALD